MNPAWAEARKAIYPLPAVTTKPVHLDYLDQPAPCVACDQIAYTAYQGVPFHILCTVELAFYVECVKLGRVKPLPALKGLLPSG